MEWRALQRRGRRVLRRRGGVRHHLRPARRQFYLRLATEALIFGGLALSVDILLGFAGLLSLGQALYFGLGAYTAALVLKQVSRELLAGDGGERRGRRRRRADRRHDRDPRARRLFRADHLRPRADRRQGDLQYARERSGASRTASPAFPIITVPLGLRGRRRPTIPPASSSSCWRSSRVIYLALVYLAGTPFGRALAGVRINEKRLPFLGYRPERLKLAAFVLAATIASLAAGSIRCCAGSCRRS